VPLRNQTFRRPYPVGGSPERVIAVHVTQRGIPRHTYSNRRTTSEREKDAASVTDTPDPQPELQTEKRTDIMRHAPLWWAISKHHKATHTFRIPSCHRFEHNVACRCTCICKLRAPKLTSENRGGKRRFGLASQHHLPSTPYARGSRMIQPFRTPHRAAVGGGAGVETLGHREPLRRYAESELLPSDCNSEPPVLTYRQAREILYVHDVHGPQCRQWLAAAAYLSAGLDDE